MVSSIGYQNLYSSIAANSKEEMLHFINPGCSTFQFFRGTGFGGRRLNLKNTRVQFSLAIAVYVFALSLHGCS